MFDPLKMRLMCGVTAATVALSTLAAPVSVWADDYDDFLDYLGDITDDESNVLDEVAAQTIAQDANWTSIAANMIASAAPGAVVNLVAPKALSFDTLMINTLKSRPDVGLLIAYPYNGHSYLMAVPAGYDLTSRIDKKGKVSFLSLAAVKDGKIVVTMTN